MTTATPPDVEDPRMACPMQLIVGVRIKEVKHGEAIVDRRIQITLDCSCQYELALPLHKRAPRRGEPSHCRGAHGPFQAKEPA